VLGLVLAAALLFGARAASRRLVFPTHRVATIAPPRDLRLLSLVARDGVAVHALELPAVGRGPMVVHFHNNRETAAHNAELARGLGRRGLGVMLVEFRGYGLSAEGEPSEEGLYLDAEAALDALDARGIGPERLVMWGQSLGTGVAAEMARRGRGRALVLVTPYTSIPDLVTDVVPIAPAGLLLRDVFDTAGKSASIGIPTLVIHGDEDEVVPFWMGERLARSIAGARLVRVPGGRHGDLFVRERERLLDEVAEIAQGDAGEREGAPEQRL
jgi:fermentation-respiration switch protein FrsA (DUF1100 family)